MSDVFAGPPSGAGQDGMGPWGGGRPPPVLLAALGAAALIAVMLLAFLIGKGAGNNTSPSRGSATTRARSPVSDERVLLKVVFEGEGGGRVQVVPPGDHLRAVLRARVPQRHTAYRAGRPRRRIGLREVGRCLQRHGALLGVHESHASR